MIQPIFDYVKKYWLRFVIVILAVLFFLLAHRHFVVNLEKDGRPIDMQFENIEVTNPSGYRSNIEALSRYDERNYIYNLSGWAFSLETSNQPTDQIETIIVLVSNKNKFYYESFGIERLDVEEAFKDLELNLVKPGFSVLINQQLLPADEYCIGILLRNPLTSAYQFINTNAELIREGWSLELAKENNKICESVFDEYEPIVETISLPEITDQIKYFVDDLSIIENQVNSYHLIGWAFSTSDQDKPTNVFETKIVLFDQSKRYVYEAMSTSRQDVVDAFKELSMEIVKPGYQATISTDQLPDADYCIGILLTDSQEGPDQFAVTNKVISKRDSVLELIEDDDNYCENVYMENINSNNN